MRRLLIAAAIVAVLAIVAIFALLESLGRGRLRGVVEARLSATFGQPVSIGRLRVAPFSRLAVAGTDVRIGAARSHAPTLEIERIRIFPRLRSLFGGVVHVEEVRLEGFTVSVLRDEDGRWHIPAAVPAPGSSDGRAVLIDRVVVTDGRVRVFDRRAGGEVRETASIDALETHIVVDGAGLRLSPLAGRVGRATISGEARVEGRAMNLQLAARAIADDDLPVMIALLGSDRPAFLRLGEPASVSAVLEVDRTSSRLTGSGTVGAPLVVLEPIQLQGLEARFVIHGSRLEFSPTKFQIYGGAYRGVITTDIGGTPPGWAAESHVDGMDIGEFLDALTRRTQQVDGTATITAGVRGRVGEALERTVRGRVDLIITNGVVRDFPLVATINRTLRLTGGEGSDTHFERLAGTFAVAAGQATTNDLVLEAGHVRVQAEGRIGADRSLALRGVAVVSAEHAARAVASVREFARLRNSRGEFEVPLTISGTLDAPSFALDVSAAVRKGVMDEIRRRIRRLIR